MKNGICFSGGGIKGAAHIGALKALEEEKIEFEYVAGTSSGSIVAVMHCLGYTADEIYLLFKKYCKAIKYMDAKNVIKLIYNLIVHRKIKIDGLNSGDKLEKLIEKYAKSKNICNIKNIKKTLIIPSVDVNNGELYIFTSKAIRDSYVDEIKYINDVNISLAVRASCSFPGVFSPVMFNGKQLVDGGIRENTAWKEAKKLGAESVLSIIFEDDVDDCKFSENIFDVVSNSLAILSHELENYELDGADCVLKITSQNIGLLDNSKIDLLYEKGYNVVKENIIEIKNKLNLV